MSSTSESSPTPNKRDLGLWDAVAVGFGAIIGAGIFVVLGVAVGVVGKGVFFSLLIAGAVALCNALSSAQLATRFPRSGGTYEYGYEVIHPWSGYIAGWLFLTSKLAAGGTVALGLGMYVARWVPSVSPLGVGLCSVILLVAANLMGIKKVGRLNLVIVGITLSALIYFIVAGFPLVAPENLQDPIQGGFKSVVEVAAMMFFAFTGYARVATLAEEVRDPKTNIPRAVWITVLASMILYLYVAKVAVGVVGPNNLTASPAPLYLAAQMINAPYLATFIMVGAMTAMLGVLLSQILGTSRVMLAMARRRDLPNIFGYIQPKTAVPLVAVLAAGIVITALVFLGRIEVLISAASFSILLYYAVTNIAALRLPRESKIVSDLVPSLGLIACLALAATLSPEVIVASLTIIAVGLVVRLIVRRFAGNSVG